MLRRTALLALLLAACPAAALSDVTFEMKVTSTITSKFGGKTETKKVDESFERFIAGDRVATVGKLGTTTIWRFDEKDRLLLYPKKKQYRRMSFAQLLEERQKMLASMAEYEKKMKAMRESLPESARKKLRDPSKPTTYTVEQGKQPRKIAGYECAHYVIRPSRGPVTEVWACEKLGPGWKHRAVNLSEAYAAALKQIKGPWLAFKRTSPGNMVSFVTVGEVTRVSTEKIDARRFEVPAGYTESKKKKSK